MSAQKPVDVETLKKVAVYLSRTGDPIDARIVDHACAELIERRARDAAVERLIDTGDELVRAARHYFAATHPAGREARKPAVRAALQQHDAALAAVRGGAK